MVGQARMHIPHRMHSVWLGVFVTSTSILQAFGAFPAGNALALVHLHLEQRNPVQQRVERAQRAEPLAEGPVEQHAQRYRSQQNAQLPREQLTQAPPVCRNWLWIAVWPPPTRPAGRDTCRICGSPMPTSLTQERWQQEHHNQQNGVFDISQRLQPPCGELLWSGFCAAAPETIRRGTETRR